MHEMPHVRCSEWVEFTYLSDTQICSWLKENYDNYTIKTDQVETDISFRDTPNVKYFYCRYAHNAQADFSHDELLFGHKKYYRDHAIALAANKHFMNCDSSIQIKIFRKLIEGFPETKAVLEELFQNPSIGRDTFTKLLEERSKIINFEDPVFFSFFFQSLASSPSLQKNYDGAYIDGYLEFRYGKFNSELQKIILDLPVGKAKEEIIDASKNLSKKEAELFVRENEVALTSSANLTNLLF